MTKRLLSQAPNPMRVSTPLDFKTWKAQRPKDQAGQRDDGHVYDSSIEDFPDQLWYTLNLDRLGEKLLHMCNELGRSIATYKIVDEEIADLRRTLMHAKLIPRPKRINIAVVGNQDMGKSSITNALMNRHLVEVMGGSEACTAFATIIEHKEGAPDDTDLSDVKVTLLSLDEIHEFVEEQIRRGRAEVREGDVRAARIGDGDVGEVLARDGARGVYGAAARAHGARFMEDTRARCLEREDADFGPLVATTSHASRAAPLP